MRMTSRGVVALGADASFGAEPAPAWVTIGWLVIFAVAFTVLTVNLLQLG